jgi:uncharacterized protein (DUF1330 family)
MAALVFSLALAAQAADQATPSASRVTQIMGTLDRNNDGKISNSEAPPELQQNFAFIDANGDGGIDLEELTRMLNMGASQRGSARSGVASGRTAGLGSPTNGPTFGTLNPVQAMRMQSISPDADLPFYMLNLATYRERAVYPDGRETNLTGREASSKYAPFEFLAEVGAEVSFVGTVETQLEGSEPTWESVAIVQYPSRAKFFQMVSNREFQAREQHKEASLEISQVIVTVRVPWVTQPRVTGEDVPFPATDQDAAFTMLQLVKYRDVAQYPAGSDEPQRSGREAMALYERSIAGILNEVGAEPLLKADVEGVLIGDGREWSELQLTNFPSHRAYREAANNAKRQQGQHHRAAAIEDIYALQLITGIDRIGQLD